MTVRRPLLPARIAGTSAPTPGQAISTAEIAARCSPARDAERLEASSGISQRYFAERLPSELAIEALTDALGRAEMSASDLERIIMVGSAWFELAAPATATNRRMRSCIALPPALPRRPSRAQPSDRRFGFEGHPVDRT